MGYRFHALKYTKDDSLHRKNPFIHIHCIKEKRVRVRYYIGGCKVLTDVLLTSQCTRCKASIFNKKASGWAFHAEGKNVGHSPRQNSRLIEKKDVKGRELL